MQLRYHCTPWQSQLELLSLRSQLYQTPRRPTVASSSTLTASTADECSTAAPEESGDDAHTDDIRRNGVSMVQAWEERCSRATGGLPLVIDSTALLVQATLYDEDVQRQHQQGSASLPLQLTPSSPALLAVRMAYAAAILRFVTGICDAKQDSRAGKMSMRVIAQDLGLPLELVEARHDISHRDLPSLGRLRDAATLGLRWLWDWYWIKLDGLVLTEERTRGVEEDPSEEDVRASRARMQVVLKRYLSDRRSEVKRKAKEGRAAETAALELGEECVKGAVYVELLQSLLVDERTIIPSDRRLNSSMDGAFLLWDGLLHRLATDHDAFFRTLTVHMQDKISALTDGDVTADPVREALCEWIVRMYTSTPWAKVRQSTHTNTPQFLLEHCFVYPNYWNCVVARNLIKSADPKLRKNWQPLLDAFTAEASFDEGVDADVSMEREVIKESFVENPVLKETVPGWSEWTGYWGRRPIGGVR